MFREKVHHLILCLVFITTCTKSAYPIYTPALVASPNTCGIIHLIPYDTRRIVMLVFP